MKKDFYRKLKGMVTLLLCLFATSVFAQNITVKGTVKDAKNEPIIGASVVVKGNPSQGAATDFDGNYSIPDVPSNATLVVSYVGMKQQEVKVNGRKTIDIVMSDDTELLDEVVVVGYGTARRRDLTGSIASLRPDKDNAALASSFDDLLLGKVAGVNISTGGSTPGSAGSVLIRGANSLTGDSQPLYVIDNVPQASASQVMGSASGDYQMAQDPLAGINPNDIEDIQILKDASATAIYGSRGANGVIIITTKKGRAGKIQINGSVRMTIAQATNLLPLMNLNQFAQYMNQKYPQDQKFKIDKNGGVFYKFEYEDEEGEKQEGEAEVFYRDWQKEAVRNAFSTDYSLNIMGGTDKIRYNFSTGYKDVNGIVANTGFKHGDMRLNLNSNLTDKLTFNINLSGFLRRNNMMSGGNTVGRVNGAIIPTAINAQPFIRPSIDLTYTQAKAEDKITVFSWLDDYDDLTKVYKISVASDLRYQFNKNLSYTLRFGGNMNNQERLNWYGLALYKGMNSNGFLSQGRVTGSNYNIENLLNYNKEFGSLRADATAAVTYDAYKWLNTGLTAKDFPLYSLRTKGLHLAKSIEMNNPAQRDYQLMSYLGRLNLSFLNGRYVLTGSLRVDGTSKFAKKLRRAYFPSFAAAWNVAEEEFLKKADWLSQFKLRVGYGSTGSQNIAPYTSIFKYAAGEGYSTPAGDVEKGMQVEVNNPFLKWETTTSFNGGVDFGIINNRFRATLDVYSKTTKDLLLNITLPGSTSFNTLTVNSGTISNKGVEIGVNADIFRSKDFTWTLGGNIAFNKSLIVDMGLSEGDFGSLGTIRAFYGNGAGDHFGAPNIFIEGKAPGLFYGYKTDGIVQEGDTYVVENPFGNSSKPGNLKVVDVDGNGVVNLQDKTIIGDPNPDYTYGFQTGLNYKAFRFKASFSGVKGGDVFNSNIRYRGLAMWENGDRNMYPEPALNAWTPENKSNVYPAVDSRIVGAIYDRYIEDGSYLRCTDITFGYTFRQDFIRKTGLSMIDVFASVKNAFTISNYTGFDPTSRSFVFDPLRRGFDLWSFPAQRAYIIGLNVSF